MKPEWLEILQRSLENNKHLPQAFYLQLATMRLDGRPANRTVVFRRFQDSSLILVTDERSEKVGQLNHSAWAEACWYFPETREQFRLLGQCKVIDKNNDSLGLRHEVWQTLSGAARQMFTWPTSGKTLDSPESFQGAIPEIKDNFMLLMLQPEQVDVLDLTPQPHQRRLYRLSQGRWQGEDVNP